MRVSRILFHWLFDCFASGSSRRFAFFVPIRVTAIGNVTDAHVKFSFHVLIHKAHPLIKSHFVFHGRKNIWIVFDCQGLKRITFKLCQLFRGLVYGNPNGGEVANESAIAPAFKSNSFLMIRDSYPTLEVVGVGIPSIGLDFERIALFHVGKR